MDIDQAAFFELDFQPNVELVTVVRRFVNEFYDRVLGDADASGRIALATHELLENSVKYCTSGPTRIRIEVGPRCPDRVVRIRTSNRTDPANREVLQTAFAKMRAAADPFEFYQVCIEEAARRSEGSGLGLARIRCEGDMTMEMECDGDLVSIVAETRTSEGVPAWTQ